LEDRGGVNTFDGVEFNTLQFLGAILVLVFSMVLTVLLFRLLFNWLPSKLFNFLIGPVALLGAYIWVIPMKMWFYEFFR
jgi:hypothetical protein